MRRLLVLGIIVATAAGVGGCARPRVQTSPDSTGLEVPTPPDRVVAPPAPEPMPDVSTPEADARPERPRTNRSNPRPEPRKEAPKPETPPTTTEATKPVPTIPAPPPAVTLQPVAPASLSEVERQVRDQIAQANATLDRADYGRLSADGKSQYDSVKRFIEQARQALNEKNFVFAGKLAEKALSLAAGLVGR